MKKLFNKETLIRNLISVIIIILVFIVEGCWNFLTFKWDFKRLCDATFWLDICIHLILLMLIRSMALNIFQNIARDKNTDLLFEKEKNKSLMKLKDNDFSSWVMTIKNKEIKIEFWKKKINRKLLKLEKFSRRKDKILYESRDEADNYAKENNKYCIKKRNLLSMLEDDWIEKNLNVLPIKNYPKIDPTIFNLPVAAYEKENNKYQINSKIKSAIAYTFLTSGCMLLFSKVLQNSLEKFLLNEIVILNVIIDMLLDVIFITWQFINGIMDSFRIIKNEELVPYINRNRILEEYIYYKSPNDKSKVKQMLDIIDSSLSNKN